MEKCSSHSKLYLLHIPWPYTGGVESQRSRTWKQQKGSQQRLECPAPRKPAGSGSLGPGSDDLSFSWQNAGGSPCGGPDKQPCQKPHHTCYAGEHRQWLIFRTPSHWWLKGFLVNVYFSPSGVPLWQRQDKATYCCVISGKPLCLFCTTFDRKVKIGFWQHNNI